MQLFLALCRGVLLPKSRLRISPAGRVSSVLSCMCDRMSCVQNILLLLRIPENSGSERFDCVHSWGWVHCRQQRAGARIQNDCTARSRGIYFAAIRADVDMRWLISKDDPAVFLECSHPDRIPSSKGIRNHHPRHADLIDKHCVIAGLARRRRLDSTSCGQCAHTAVQPSLAG